MDSLIVGGLLIVIVLLGALVALLLRRSRMAAPSSDAHLMVQNMMTLMQGTQTAMTSMQVEISRVAERVSAIDQAHARVDQGLHTIQSTMQQGLSQAHMGLAELHAQAKTRVEVEYRTAESVRRLEGVIAGTHSKGVAGENILDAVFSQLPIDWQLRDFKVKNKTVEFALRLPNNLVLPIDSKWPATSLIEQFLACDTVAEQQRLKADIEKVVLDKVREVKKYIDPDLTVNFAIAAVPDAVYDVCTEIQGVCFEHNVVLVAYSMFVPYLLLVFQTVLKSTQHIDADRLAAYVQAAQTSTQAAQDELEGRFARSLIMLGNARSDLSTHLSRINSSLTSLQLSTVEAQQPAAVLQADIAS